MRLTIDIDPSDFKASAFLDYMRTLDFISIREDKSLTPEQIAAIEVGIASIETDGAIPHDQVMADMKLRFPDLF